MLIRLGKIKTGYAMVDIVYSIPFGTNEYIALIQTFLEEFEFETHIHVDLSVFPEWTERMELNRIALNHQGPDVSHLGTTWIRELTMMNSLRPFAEGELESLGGQGEFFTGAVQSCMVGNDPTLWAVPLMVEATMISFRKDWLERAEVDRADAFGSLAGLNRAALKLAQAGVDLPVELPGANLWNLFHSLSGWIWSAGLDYCTENGKRVTIDQPEVMRVFGDYLRLIRAMSEKGRKLFAEQMEIYFVRGKSGVVLFPFTRRLSGGPIPEEVVKNWYAAPYPVCGAIGGQNLVIWNHTHYPGACVELVRYLTSAPVQKRILQHLSRLPARMKIYQDPELERDPVFDAQIEALQTGRTYPNVAQWGVVEDRLAHALVQLKTEIVQDAGLDIDQAVRRSLQPLARRLNLTLAG